MNNEAKLLTVLGALGGGAIGWFTKPGPSFKTFSSVNPEQAYMGEVLMHCLLYAGGGAVICAVIGLLMSKSGKDAS